jgi:glycosyltransferase involved in cell wall biosynthesis
MSNSLESPILVVTQQQGAADAPDVAIFADSLAAALGATQLSVDSKEFVARAQTLGPTRVVYVPTPGAFASKLQVGRRIRRNLPNAQHLMIHLPPLRESDRPRWPASGRYPDPVLVSSYRSLLALSRMSLKGDVVPVGVDVSVFHPAEQRVREVARSRLSIAPGKFVFLWDAGNADLDAVVEFREQIAESTVLLLRSSGPPIAAGERDLGKLGIRLFDPPEQILELLWAADAFVYSHAATGGAMELPLMVFGALAAGLPVLTRPCGGLPDFLEPARDLCFWSTMDALVGAARRLQETGSTPVRPMTTFSWDNVASRVVDVFGRSNDRDLAVSGR